MNQLFKVLALPNYPEEAERVLNTLVEQGYVAQTIEWSQFSQSFWVFAVHYIREYGSGSEE